jgi:hypothetical protein
MHGRFAAANLHAMGRATRRSHQGERGTPLEEKVCDDAESSSTIPCTGLSTTLQRRTRTSSASAATFAASEVNQ